jgi:transcriptional regulator with XRE-family HTH domain
MRGVSSSGAFSSFFVKGFFIFFFYLFFVTGACLAAGSWEDDAMASVEFSSTPAAAASFPVVIPSHAAPPRTREAQGKPRAAPDRESAGRPSAARPTGASRPTHRLREVRLQQGFTLRTVARHMGVSVRQLRAEEEGQIDLRLSDLQRWQEVLGVPLEDLLQEPVGSLSRPVMERAQLVRLMKTAAALLENAPTPRMERLAQTLVEQLVEIMPELQHVNPWHAVGQRRTLDDLGRAAEYQYSDHLFHG